MINQDEWTVKSIKTPFFVQTGAAWEGEGFFSVALNIFLYIVKCAVCLCLRVNQVLVIMLKRSDSEMSCCLLDWKKDTSPADSILLLTDQRISVSQLWSQNKSMSTHSSSRQFLLDTRRSCFLSHFLSGLQRFISFPEGDGLAALDWPRLCSSQPCLGANGFAVFDWKASRRGGTVAGQEASQAAQF